MTMPNGMIHTSEDALRDLKTKQTYTIPSKLRGRPGGTLVTYTLAPDKTVDSITPGLVGKLDGDDAVDDATEQRVPLGAALRNVYPDGIQVRLYGTSTKIIALDPLGRVIGGKDRRIDLVDPSHAAPDNLSELGVSVEQDSDDKSDDDPDQVYYYVGKKSAWTTRIQTCTALAMWSRSAGLSYLSHADAATPSETIAKEMTRFFEAAAATDADLSASGELSVFLFTASDTPASRFSSLETTFLALNHIKGEYARYFFERAKCHIVGHRDAVVVSSTARPKVLRPYADYVPYLLTRYAERGEEHIRGILIDVLRTAEPNRDFEPQAYKAAKKAGTEHRDLQRLLYTVAGYSEQEAAERWDL
ncbi:hypothetical protein [Sphaerisporangium rubeum]|nr:hypothetical protein [Sphaerisporangium rubeum]